METEEQKRVLENDKKNMIVSASAGSGKTYVLIKYICDLVIKKKIPIKKFLILTFTKVAATEMKERLLKELKSIEPDEFVIKQIDDLSVSNISTIHSFCEYCLKKYANILEIDENFEIADENFASKLKAASLNRAIVDLEESSVDDMTNINYAYKNDRRKIGKAIFGIEEMTKVVQNRAGYLDMLQSEEEQQEKLYSVVTKYLNEEVENVIKFLNSEHFDDIAFDIKMGLSSFLSAKTLKEKCEACKGFKFPTIPKEVEIGASKHELLEGIKSTLTKSLNKFVEIYTSSESTEGQDFKLEQALVKLYLRYEEEYTKQKQNKKLLDFNDLEQYMLKLSKTNLFKEEFEFVFVDEYQDTNFLQAGIIKKVAENANFVAVGDAKQGIYGFRLASSTIFLNDVKEFEKDENSNMVNLTTNFRSNQRVLNFVNDVFKDVMLEETTDIDYQSTSMLKEFEPFEDDGNPAITIDVIAKKEKIDKDFDVYSVKEDVVDTNINTLELEAVKTRIDQILHSKIYDKSIKGFRDVKKEDIAILSRTRNAFYYALEKYLKENGYDVAVSVKRNLLESPEINVILNLLKIVLNPYDEIAMLSVLMSNFGRFGAEQIFEVCKEKQENLYKIILKNEIFAEFLQDYETFKNNIICYGIRESLERVFEKTHYYSYINAQSDVTLKSSVDKFLDEVVSSGYDFDLPNLINYFESVDIVDDKTEQDKASILLTTIHATKGLEYPIVILINCDKVYKDGKDKMPIKLDEELGLAVKSYDESEEIESLKMYAIKLKEARKRYVEEMMLFYVALTRAKNRLYLIGEDSIKQKASIHYNTYFDYVFALLTEDEYEKFRSESAFLKGDILYNFIDKIESIEVAKDEPLTQIENKKFFDRIKEYIEFEYKYKNEDNISFKNSVTALTKKFEDASVFIPTNDYLNINSNAVEIGNAYHLALKLLDFDEIDSKETLEKKLKNLEQYNIVDLIDRDILYNNIQLLKGFTKGKVFKEKEFILKDTLANLIGKDNLNDEVMVQGIIDFFMLKENNKATLIDYKFSNERNSDKLIARYINQLKMYKTAIENGISVKVDEIYLLNLKYNNLIKVEI